MAKAKKGSKENPITTEDLANIKIDGEKKRSYKIIEALLKDGFCNYTYQIISGIGINDSHGVKSKSGTIKDDMYDAFARLKVHLAVIDDVFKNSKVEFEDIDTMHSDEITLLYEVTGIKIKGSEESESVILIGNKYVSAGGRITLESPKISLDELSSYKWYNELKTEVDAVREEVALYKEGKYIPVEEDEPEQDPKQMKITYDTDGKEVDQLFENAEV